MRLRIAIHIISKTPQEMSYHIYYWWKGRMIFEKKNPQNSTRSDHSETCCYLLVSQPEPETGNAFAQMGHYTPLPRQRGQKTTKNEKWVESAYTMDYWTFPLLTPHFADHSPRLTLKPAVSPLSFFFAYLSQSPEVSRLEKDKQERQTRRERMTIMSDQVASDGSARTSTPRSPFPFYRPLTTTNSGSFTLAKRLARKTDEKEWHQWVRQYTY